MGIAFDAVRARVKVWRREEKPFVPAPGVVGGDGRRLAADGRTGGLLFRFGRVDAEDAFAFFLPAPNERRNDHSPSNWIPSNSSGKGEWSKIAESMSVSILRSI